MRGGKFINDHIVQRCFQKYETTFNNNQTTQKFDSFFYNKTFYIYIESYIYTDSYNSTYIKFEDKSLVNSYILFANNASVVDSVRYNAKIVTESIKLLRFNLLSNPCADVDLWGDRFASNDTPLFGNNLIKDLTVFAAQLQTRKFYGKLVAPINSFECACLVISLGKYLPNSKNLNNSSMLQYYFENTNLSKNLTIKLSSTMYRMVGF